MWTFTVDPSVGNPRDVYEHLKRVRAIAETVRTLFNAGHLRTRHYFCAVEFQMGKRRTDGGPGTGQVHFHVLLDTNGFVPIAAVQGRWDSFRPSSAPPVERDYWLLGKCEFEQVDNRESMAHYMCKYMAKGPQEGLPEWFRELLDEKDAHGNRKFNAVAYTVSKGFWKQVEKDEPPPGPVDEEEEEEGEERTRKRTLTERLERCMTNAVLMRVRKVMADDGELIARHEFLGPLAEGWASIAERLEVNASTGYAWLRDGEESTLEFADGTKVGHADTTSTQEERNNAAIAEYIRNQDVAGARRMVGYGSNEAWQVSQLDDRPSLRIMETAHGSEQAPQTEEKETRLNDGEHKRAGAGMPLLQHTARESGAPARSPETGSPNATCAGVLDRGGRDERAATDLGEDGGTGRKSSINTQLRVNEANFWPEVDGPSSRPSSSAGTSALRESRSGKGAWLASNLLTETFGKGEVGEGLAFAGSRRCTFSPRDTASNAPAQASHSNTGTESFQTGSPGSIPVEIGPHGPIWCLPSLPSGIGLDPNRPFDR
jgi:hypothetical protein